MWSVDDGYYIEQVPSVVSGVGDKNYQLPFRVPDTNGVYEYRVEVLYKDGEEWVTADPGSVDFQIEVSGGQEPGPMGGLGDFSLPSLSGLNIPELPGYVWGVVGLIVGALSMPLYQRY